jgi:hypothetical protein
LQIQHATADRDEQVRKVIASIDTITGSRIRRADLSSAQERLDQVSEGLVKLRKENDKSEPCSSLTPFCVLKTFVARQRLWAIRENLATRRRTLSQAKLLPPAPLEPLISRETAQLNTRAETIARARSGLVSELVEVFNIVEVGGRPPIGGKAGTKGEWTIGDLVLPVHGDIRRTAFIIYFFQVFASKLTVNRIPSRPYQRSHNTHTPLHRSSHLLPWCPPAIRDYMDWAEARCRTTLDPLNQRDRNW